MKQKHYRYIIIISLVLTFSCSKSENIISDNQNKNAQDDFSAQDDTDTNDNTSKIVSDDFDVSHHRDDGDNKNIINDSNAEIISNKTAADFVSTLSEQILDQDVEANVYFSPYDDTRKLVIQELEKAKNSVSLVFFNLRDDKIFDELIKLHKQNIVIKVYLDEYQAGLSYNTFDDNLRAQGIEVNTIYVGTAENSSMHNKFAIIDNKTVLTGTMNWSTTSFDSNYEHFFKITHQVIVKQFIQLFESIENKTDIITFEPDNENFAVFFAPHESLQPLILTELKKAQKNIYLIMYHLNQKELVNELISAHERGVKLIIVLDKRQHETESSDEDLIEKNIPVFLVSLDDEFSRMHEKAVVIDNEIVIAGSYNWTSLASFHNYETLLKIKDSDIAYSFHSQMFRVLKDLAQNEFKPQDLGFSVDTIPITITLENISADVQKNYFISGDVASLGKWNQQKAIAMTEDHGKIKAIFDNTPGTTIKFKIFYKSDNTEWFEPGPLHKTFIPYGIDRWNISVELRE